MQRAYTVQIFIDVIAADGGYVACGRPVPATVGVGKVVPTACRFALGLDRDVDDRMAVYHVEEMRFLEWPGFTETAVREFDTLIVVASSDPSFESGKNLEGLWLVAAGLDRRARFEGQPGATGPSARRSLNRNVVVRGASPAPEERPRRAGRSATDIALEVALADALEELAEDIPPLATAASGGGEDQSANDGAGRDAPLFDMSRAVGGPAPRGAEPTARGGIDARGSSPLIPRSELTGVTARYDAVGDATERHDALAGAEAPTDATARHRSVGDATARYDAILDALARRDATERCAAIGDATERCAAIDDSTERCTAIDDSTERRVAVDDARSTTGARARGAEGSDRWPLRARGAASAAMGHPAVTLEGLASPADVVRRRGRAPTFIDAASAARADTELASAAHRAELASATRRSASARRSKPRTQPPKPPPGARHRRPGRSAPPSPPPGGKARRRAARAPTHL